MKFKLETPQHQTDAIRSVVDIFDGMEKNTYDNSQFEEIYANTCSLTPEEVYANIHRVCENNGISDENACYEELPDVCIEMETGTGKTLTYIQTAYELYARFGLSKFIVLVPSVPIRQGVIDTFENFKDQLAEKYNITPNAFVYDSAKLSKLRDFISQDNPQIMILTMASFNSDDNILNRKEVEGLFNNQPHIDSLSQTHPIIFMDEPQEGMDTENSIAWISKLSPLFKIRYSATHKVKRNLLYELSPSESYKLGLVKKIEVLTVAEKNDEATLKLEISSVQESKQGPKVKLKFWKLNKTKGTFEFKESGLLKKGDNLAEKSGNDSYYNYTIGRIYKKLATRKWVVEFTNDAFIEESQTSANKGPVWAMQLEWLIRRHFENQRKLHPKGIKNLSLIFIDRVANYMSSERPIIKQLFEEKYRELYPEYHDGKLPTSDQVNDVQGFYFAKTSQGEYTDNEKTNKSNKEIYDQILHNKHLLLSFTSPIEFIFSHSALGVGWDNPNVFGIATLNESYSENKKRQEIGRGLRICVNQNGERIYDADGTPEDDLLNQLTVVPNETYETFVREYQEGGNGKKMPKPKHNHKGENKSRVTFKLNSSDSVQKAFKEFWKRIAMQTDYTVDIDEDSLIEKSIEAINEINIERYFLEVSSYRVRDVANMSEGAENYGSDYKDVKGRFTPSDLIEDLSEKTGVCYNSIMKIVKGIYNLGEYLKNPPVFTEQAAVKIRSMQLNELVRGVNYKPTDEYPYQFESFVKDACDNYVDTPNHGLWDKTLYDSKLEMDFAIEADKPAKRDVVCFLKFPDWYYIKTPIGDYRPDFGLVIRKKKLSTGEDNEYYFVIEIKGTNEIADPKALTPHEVARIRCAIKHFQKLGIDIDYVAPVKEYDYFEKKANEYIKPKMNDNGNI